MVQIVVNISIVKPIYRKNLNNMSTYIVFLKIDEILENVGFKVKKICTQIIIYNKRRHFLLLIYRDFNFYSK